MVFERLRRAASVGIAPILREAVEKEYETN
jgi:hypothetical protein